MMRGIPVQFLSFLLLLGGVLVGGAEIAYAKDKGPLEIHKAGSMDSKEDCRSKYQGELLAVIVPCIRDVIQDATETMATQFDDVMRRSIWVFTILVVTLFGVKMLLREGDLKKQGAILLFKIAGMALFIDNFGGFIPDVFGMVQEAVEIVTSALGDQLSNGKCDTSKTLGEKPWNFLDCILGEIFGFGPRATIGGALFGLLGSALGSGKFGPVLALGGVMVIYFILRLILRAVYTYLMSLIVVGFLIVMSPLLIPLILLGVTFQYFEHWLRALTASMLLPMIVLAYVTLAFLALDHMLYDEEKGLAKQLTEDDATGAHNQSRSRFASHAVPNKASYEFDHTREAYAMRSNPAGNGADGMLGFNTGYTIDFKDKNTTKSISIHYAMVALVIMVYLLDTMLDTLVRITQMLLGGAFALTGAVADNPLESQLNKFKNEAMSAAGKTGDAAKALNPFASSGFVTAMKNLIGQR